MTRLHGSTPLHGQALGAILLSVKRSMRFAAGSPFAAFIAGFLLALCASLALWLAYPQAIISPDADIYTFIATHFPIATSPGFDVMRGIGFPLIIRFALLTSQPGIALFWFNALSYCLAIGCISWIVRLLTGRPYTALIFTLLLVVLELLLLEPFITIITVLPDAPFSFLMLSGAIIAYGGWMNGSARLMLAGGMLIGISDLIRPMHVHLLPWIAIGMYLLIKGKQSGISRTVSAVFLLLIILPGLSWAARNKIVYGEKSTSTLFGLHLMTHAAPIWEEGDTLFLDPALNADFFEAVRTDILPPEYNPSMRLWHKRGEKWHTIFQFIGSQTAFMTDPDSRPETYLYEEYTRQTAALAADISMRAIRLHPMAYAWNVLSMYVQLFNPYSLYSFQSDIFLPDPAESYKKMTASNPSWYLLYLYYGEQGGRNIRSVLPGMGYVFRTIADDAGLRSAAAASGPLLFIWAHASAAFAVLLLSSRSIRKKMGDAYKHPKWTAGFMLLLFVLIALNNSSVAFLSLHGATRYSVPVLLPLHLLILLPLLGIIILLPKYLRELFLAVE